MADFLRDRILSFVRNDPEEEQGNFNLPRDRLLSFVRDIPPGGEEGNAKPLPETDEGLIFDPERKLAPQVGETISSGVGTAIDVGGDVLGEVGGFAHRFAEGFGRGMAGLPPADVARQESEFRQTQIEANRALVEERRVNAAQARADAAFIAGDFSGHPVGEGLGKADQAAQGLKASGVTEPPKEAAPGTELSFRYGDTQSLLRGATPMHRQAYLEAARKGDVAKMAAITHQLARERAIKRAGPLIDKLGRAMPYLERNHPEAVDAVGNDDGFITVTEFFANLNKYLPTGPQGFRLTEADRIDLGFDEIAGALKGSKFPLQSDKLNSTYLKKLVEKQAEEEAKGPQAEATNLLWNGQVVQGQILKRDGKAVLQRLDPDSGEFVDAPGATLAPRGGAEEPEVPALPENVKNEVARIQLKVLQGEKISTEERNFLDEVAKMSPLERLRNTLVSGALGGVGSGESAEDRTKRLTAEFEADPDAEGFEVIGTNEDGSLRVRDKNTEQVYNYE